ncbi:LysR family transcriptional regulator [Verminephrobacter aporrectodeae subsp. tuberculatae]|uniref:LysR family transcriptional regulator n=1 Tax=Verminephrobacter aporrectodeae TaxID=1110389 RepID=UPI00224446C0|nr:LysR family transcriptional regulator [Verminephrobacter aporrectodeae]MCW8163648.1 LysR family transcriptional regulator [Verminephrobacter aporrectodeae subsp. tuberculatae]MCW8168482.1 LysR family transcriptional regulator [Verminephrobacter aporrectodeae subsp. tuberculatae]MCW8206934.1 LysR family transcriptional regulator [Verminephrobacter aporrectodeae subsp. tuberculatae]
MPDHRHPLVSQLFNRLRMRQLALVLAFAEHGTLRRAAAELGMSQPAATKMIQELESALGQRLFAREGRGQRLTPAGERVLDFFQGMRGSMESMVRELEELQLGNAGRVSVGCIMAPLPTWLNPAIIALNKAYPRVTIQVTLDTSEQLVELLEDGSIDIAIGRVAPGHGAQFCFHPLDNESLAVVVGVGHPLAKRKLVAFANLLEYSWILQPPGSPLREVLEQEFRALQAPLPRGLIETASILCTMRLIADTTMIAVLPLSVVTVYAQHHLLKILPCQIKHKMGAFGSITRQDRPLSEAARYFLSALHRSQAAAAAGA